MTMDKKKLVRYLIWTFAIAWVFQIIGSIFSLQGNSIMFTLILSVSMFAPFLGTVLAKIPLRGMGFKPKLKGNLKYIALAWFGPAVFTILGAALYFLIFPSRLDLTGMYIREVGGEAVILQLADQGLTIPSYMAISVITSLIYAPWINMFFALGEEVGWRGAMDPMLKDRFGKVKGSIMGGIIWGAWHWPVMIIAGYEYGRGYWGEPVFGMIMFCLFTVVAGTLLDFLYEKTGCIWVPALGHGAVNGICSMPMLILNTAYSNQLTIGPLPIGFISMIPMMIAAGIILYKQREKK